jgi:outer membrane protein OmpA-like peptidoglycan-associated protein
VRRSGPPRRRPGALAALGLASVVTCLAGGSGDAAAQEVASRIDLQQFRPRAGAGDVLGVESARVQGHGVWRLGVLFNSADDPLVARTADGDELVRLVDAQTTADLLFAVGLWDRYQVSLELPVVLHQDTGAMSSEIDRAGVGDLRIVPKARLVDRAVGRGRLGLAGSVELIIPSGIDFHSQDSFGAQPQLAGDYTIAGSRLVANLGLRLRNERQLIDINAGTELTYGLGARLPLPVGGDRIAAIGTLSGAVGLADTDREELPLELLAGAEVDLGGGILLTAGGGPGLSRGYGTPDLRFLVGVTYRGANRAGAGCAFGPEDIDGFADDDGCADLDNDGDGIADEVDTCPNEREVVNGVRDDDGCPDTAIAAALDDRGDAAIELPRATDDDRDGVVGSDDLCPDQPEDRDEFEDADGCPDDDNDGDGIADADDRCPLSAETVNQFEDADGCPDQGRTIPVLDRIRFDSGKATIRKESHATLDQIARVLLDQPHLTKVRVDGHTDNVGDARDNRRLSQRRAQAVAAYLIAKGVSARRLAARGFGDTRPLVPNDSPENRERNRRVELTILEVDGKPLPEEPEGAQP